MKEPINNFTQVMSTCPPGEYWKNFDLIEKRLRGLEEDLEGLTDQRQESVMISRETYEDIQTFLTLVSRVHLPAYLEQHIQPLQSLLREEVE